METKEFSEKNAIIRVMCLVILVQENYKQNAS